MIYFLTLFIKHNVGKVIIFVDNEIKTDFTIMRLQIQVVQLIIATGLRFHFFGKAGVVLRLIYRGEIINNHTAVIVEVLCKIIIHSANTGKVHINNLELSLQRCWLLTYPQIAETLLEFIFLGNVIICPQHTQEDTFTETTGTDKEQITRLLFQQG